MAEATVRQATAEEATQVADWFPSGERAGLDAAAAAREFVAACQDGRQTLRVLVEGGDILAAVCSRRVPASVGGERVGLVMARGGAPESGRRNASVPILLRGVLRQYPGASVACVTGGADPRALKKMGFAPWKRGSVQVAAGDLPRVPSGARCRPAFAVDLANLVSTRAGAAGPVAVQRSEADWQRLLDRWRGLAAAGASAPDAHVVRQDDTPLGYVVAQRDGETLEILEAAGEPAAIAGAAGALARGQGCTTVRGPGIAGLADAEGAAPLEDEDFTMAARLTETVELAEVKADPLSGVDRL